MAAEYWKELELKRGRFKVGIWKLKLEDKIEIIVRL